MGLFGLTLKGIGKRIEGLGAQANPLDNGATYNTVLQNKKPQASIPIKGHMVGDVMQGGYSPPSTGQQAHNLAAGILHPFSTFASAAIHTPQAIYREVQGKPIYDIQQNVFGTTDPRSIRNQIIGDTLAAGTLALGGPVVAGVGKVVTPRIASPLLAKTVTGAVSGSALNTGFGVGGNIAAGVPLKQYPKSLAESAALGAGLGAAGPVVGASARSGAKVTLKTAKAIRAYDQAQNQIGAVGRNVPRPTVSLKKNSTPVKGTIKPAGQGSKLNIDPTDPFGNRNIITRIRSGLGKSIEKDADMIRLLKGVEKQTGKKGLVDQWYFDTGNIRASNAMANSKLVRDPHVAAGLGGLSKSDLKGLDEYARARVELRNYEGKKTSRSPEENQRIVTAGEAKYGERFGALNDYYKGQAKELYDAGIIDAKKYRSYVSSDDYLRIQRDMDDLVNPQIGHSESRSFRSTTATQKRTGSERSILSPTESLAHRTQQLQLEINRNKAATNIIDVLEKNGLAHKVSEGKGKNTVSRFTNGKKQTYEVPKEIKEVIDNVNPYHLGIIARIVSAPVRLVRAGLTGLSAPFAIVNYVRDQVSSAIFSKNIRATHGPINAGASLGSATRDFVTRSNHPLWEKFERYYGNQTIFDELRNAKSTRRQLREIRKGGRGKAFNMATSPIRTLEDLIGITEKATRFQNFKGIYKKAINSGKSEDEAIREAVIAARQNSVDFSRNGDFTRIMNLMVPYFNASAQGSRNLAKAFRDRPVGTTAKTVGLVAIPTIALTAWNYSDDKRREVYESIDDFEKEGNYIVVGPNPKQRADGSWEGVWKIPKPQGYRNLVDPARELAEGFFKGETSVDVASITKDLLASLSGPVQTDSLTQAVGSVVPQQAKPLVQANMNKDLYTGKPIVPDYMLNATDGRGNPINPSKQAYNNTSGTARIIANQLGVSPIKVEKFIADTTGSVGRYTLNTSDNVLASRNVIPKEQIGGRSVISDVKRRVSEASGELLEKNKSDGAKHYDKLAEVTKNFTGNEMSAFDSLHPAKKNFLGDTIYEPDSVYNSAARLDIYNRFPAVFEADKKLDADSQSNGAPGNPLFKLQSWQLKKVLEKENLPPGATDKELSKLYAQPWYSDYQNDKNKYYTKLNGYYKDKIAQYYSEGNTKAADALRKSEAKYSSKSNPYPITPDNLQKAMDQYSALAKGTGDRSAWIKANPGLWSAMTTQWAKVDAWQNNQRVARGLDTTEGASGVAAGYGSSSGGYGKGSSNPHIKSKYSYAVGRASKPPRVSVSVKKAVLPKIKGKGTTKPRVTLKRSLV